MPTPQQIAAARPYLTNVDEAAAAADASGCPWWLLCAVIDKETHGKNIYGHDKGGALSGPANVNVEVTEANYAQFRRLVLVEHKTSNGVGPLQLTWPGFFSDMESQGLKPWLPADSILYGARLLASYFNAAAGTTAERVRTVGVRYNGNASYGDDLVRVALLWATRLIIEETDVPLTDADLAAIGKLIDTRLAALPKAPTAAEIAGAVWESDTIPSADPDPTNPAWRPSSYLGAIYRMARSARDAARGKK